MQRVNVAIVNFMGGGRIHPIDDGRKSSYGISSSFLNHLLDTIREQGFDARFVPLGTPKIDILVASCGGNIKSVGPAAARSKKVLFWTEENISRKRINPQAIRNVADYWVGYCDAWSHGPSISADQFRIRYPHWMDYSKSVRPALEEGENGVFARLAEANSASLEGRNRWCCFIAGNKTNGRLRFLTALRRLGMRVDCAGRVGANMPRIRGNSGTKVKFIEGYVFNLCPENSAKPGYVTEKIIECCMGGAIPIYWGEAKLEPGVVNPDRVIYCERDGVLGPKAEATIKRLLSSEEELEKFFAQPPFLPTALETLRDHDRRLESLVAQMTSEL